MIGHLLAAREETSGGIGWGSLLAVGILFGLPAASWKYWRTRRGADALNVFLAWEAATLPAVVLITPLF